MKGVSVDIFKAALDTWLASIPDQPTTDGRQRAALTNALIQPRLVVEKMLTMKICMFKTHIFYNLR